MKLKEYKEAKGYTYRALAEFLGIPKTLAFHLCKGPYPNLRLEDAKQVQRKTNGAVTLEEL